MGLLQMLLNPAVLALLIPITAILTVGAITLVRLWARHQERMAMIEAGMHPDEPLLPDPDELHSGER
jgi:hypothetical protein